MFWICGQNSVDSTGMSQLLLGSAFTGSRPFLLSYCPTYLWSRLGVHEKLWEDTAGTASPTAQRDVPCHGTLRSAVRNKGRRRKKGSSVFVSLNNTGVWWSPSEYLPVDVKWWMNSWFCFVCRMHLWLCLWSRLNLKVLSLLPFQFSYRGESELVSLQCLATSALKTPIPF